MLQLFKRAGAVCMALILILTIMPLAALGAENGGTTVESLLDFTTMNAIAEGSTNDQKAASKEQARQKLIDAGAVDAQNLFLVGNWETIVNPGGYNGAGYFVQKVEAVAGETIQNATLNLGYWVATSDPQGYVQVWVSSDNKNYTKVFEQNEGNGDAFTTATRRSETITLPVEDGQTEIYVKVVMEHWNTYEGAGVAYSKLVINAASVSVDSDKAPEECTMVTASHNFNSLGAGEVSVEDIGAVEEMNMYFGIDGVTLLSPRNGYEIATATWMLEAAEGEPLYDCVLTIVGRTFFINESVKDDNYLKVYASSDGLNFTEVTDFRANDNADDTQRFVVDVTEVISGHSQAYVKLEWLVFDSPHIFGIRSVTLTGNTAGINNSEEGSGKLPISNVQSFTSLDVGEVDAEDLQAFKSANLMFGYNKTPLLTASEAGEDAYVTWKLAAANGETFEDCYLTLIGKFGYVNEEMKDTSVMKVYLSTDAETYSVVKEITPTEDQTDTQKITIDLSAQSYGLSELYVRVYWTSKDDPAGMGLRAMALVANAGADYDLYTPEPEDRVITDEEMGVTEITAPVETTTPAESTSVAGSDQSTQSDAQTNVTQPNDTDETENGGNGWIIWVVVAVVIVAAVVILIVGRKKKNNKAE